ncbi:MAG: hypothetical protein GX424_05250 [Clostridiales bacterium]|nr:hypothetical protein [Clostridiales bacterium]
MQYVTKPCPHCGKELQLPQDAENIVCMYCAKPIHVKELLSPEPGENYASLMEEAERLLADELFLFPVSISEIRSSTYPEKFEQYETLFRPALKAYGLAAAENAAGASDRFAGVLLDRFFRRFEAEGIKKTSDTRLFDIRYMIVSFTIPSILKQKTPEAEALADRFLEKWNAHYPKNPLGKASYDSINSGFRKKFCFITTAVCSSLGKGDDCAELNTLRGFRDEWMAGTPGGRAKIGEYYLFAPMIVAAIDRSGNAGAVYREIWEQHLSPCLDLIHAGKQEECAAAYENMVLLLERKWLS